MSLFILNMFDNCIFCGELLPPKAERKNQEGEHVFPKNIKGFIKSRDVCSNCIQHFGKEIDKSPHKNLETLEAMKKLGLTNKDYIEGQEFVARDLLSNKLLDFVVDKKGPRIKNIKKDNFYQTTEENFNTLGIEWLRKDLNNKFDKDTLDKELSNFKKKYYKAQYGEIIQNERLGCFVNKGQAEIIKAKDKSVSLRKLVAKIVVIFINYIFSPQEISLIREYNKIKDFAMGKGEVSDYTIYRSKLFDDNNYKKYHIVRIEILEKFINVTVIFFGRISYSLPISSIEKINLITKRSDEPLKEITLVLDFEDKCKTFLEFRDNNKPVVIEINM